MTKDVDVALNLLQNGLLPQVHGAYYDALKMAIEALKEKHQANPSKKSDSNALNALECVDAISRKAAIDELVRWVAIPEYNGAEKNIMACCIGMLSTLPPVKPKNGFFEFIINKMNPNEYQEYWNSYYCSGDEKGCE